MIPVTITTVLQILQEMLKKPFFLINIYNRNLAKHAREEGVKLRSAPFVPCIILIYKDEIICFHGSRLKLKWVTTHDCGFRILILEEPKYKYIFFLHKSN